MSKSSKSPNLAGLIIVLLFVSIILFLFTWLIVNNIGQAFLATATIIFSGVLARLIFDLANRVSIPLSDKFDYIFGGNKKIYCDYILKKYTHFDTSGLTIQPEIDLKLGELFIDIHLETTRRNKLGTESGEDNNIWMTISNDNKDFRVPQIVLLGEPGSGKTTLLRHVAIVLASGKSQNRPSPLYKKVPIYLQISAMHKFIIENPNISLEEVVLCTINQTIENLGTNWFKLLLKSGACVVLLDGLDEIADSEKRNKVVIWIQEQIDIYQKNSFVITSRPFGYIDNQLRGVSVLNLLAYSKKQIEDFIQKWYLANAVGQNIKDKQVSEYAKIEADLFLQELNNKPKIWELCTTPLFLTLILAIHNLYRKLPERRLDLFDDIMEIMLERRKRVSWERGSLTHKQKVVVLYHLAYEMMCRKLERVSKLDAASFIQEKLSKVTDQLLAEEFLERIKNDSGILIEYKNDNQYAFTHLTFQEYLASCFINYDSTNESEKILIKNIGDAWWSETIRLYAAQTDATKILAACLEVKSPSALGLAVDVLHEAQMIDPAVSHSFASSLFDSIDANLSDGIAKTFISKALLSLRLRLMNPLDSGRHLYIDNSLITKIEYQLFLNEMYQKSKYFFPDHWTEKTYEIGSGKDYVSVIRSDDAIEFCNWISKFDVIRSSVYSLPKKSLANEVTDLMYWVLDDNGIPIVFSGKKPYMQVGEDMISAQLESDYVILENTIQVINHSKSKGMPSKISLKQNLELVENHVLLEKKASDIFTGKSKLVNFRKFFAPVVNASDTLNLLFVSLANCQETINHLTSFIRSHNISYDFDLGKTYKVSREIIGSSLSRTGKNNSKLITASLLHILDILIERRWQIFDGNISFAYDDLRLLARLLSVSLFCMCIDDLDNVKSQLGKLYMHLTVLECQIYDKEYPSVGIRISKFDKR